MAVPPQVYPLVTPFTWVGREAILGVSGTFAGEAIAVEYSDGTNWVPTSVSGDPGYITVAGSAVITLSPGLSCRLTNFGSGDGAGQALHRA